MAVGYNPRVTTDGLVLALDVGNSSKSYKTDNNLLDARTWYTGYNSTNGITGFGFNETDSGENALITDTDPFGNTAVIWKSQSPDGNADGGWNTGYIDVDHTKLYRFSVWVNRKVTGTDGRFYLGTRGYNSSLSNVGVLSRSSGTNDTNPYFYYSSEPPTSSEMPEDEWVLVVAHVWPSGSGTGSSKDETGIYNTDGTKRSVTTPFTPKDFVWNTTVAKTAHRTYLFYSEGDTSVIQHWAYPRIDLVDGTEPSINDLIHNRVNNLYLYDISGQNNHGTLNNGITFDSGNLGSLGFDGNFSQVYIPHNSSSMDFSSGQTICMWIKPASGSNTARRNPYNQAYGGPGTLTYETNATITYYFGTNGGNGTPYVGRESGFTVSAGETAFITVTRDQATDVTNWYKNGALITTADAGGYASTANGTSPILIGDGYVSGFLGDIYDCKVYNRALTATEVLQNYNALKGRF